MTNATQSNLPQGLQKYNFLDHDVIATIRARKTTPRQVSAEGRGRYKHSMRIPTPSSIAGEQKRQDSDSIGLH
jgi:hypothetical protein